MNTTGSAVVALAYVIAASVHAVTTAALLETAIPPTLSLLVNFLPAMVIFSLLARWELARTKASKQSQAPQQSLVSFWRHAWGKCRGSVIRLNACTAALWFCYAFALNMVEPAVYVFVAFGVTPVATLFFSPEEKGKHGFRGLSRTQLLILAAITTCVLLMGLRHIFIHEWKAGVGFVLRPIGVGLSVLGGVLASYYLILTQKPEVRTEFTPVQIIAVRFPLLVGLAFLANTATRFHGIGPLLEGRNLLLAALLVALSTLPLYLMQLWISRGNAVDISVLIFWAPAITIALEYFRLFPEARDAPYDKTDIWLLSVGVALMIAYAWLRRWERRSSVQAECVVTETDRH